MNSRLFFFANPNSSIAAMSFISLATSCVLASFELCRKHLRYSKFWSSFGSGNNQTSDLPSWLGMILFYTPSFLATLAYMLIFPGEVNRTLLLLLAIVLLLFKRIFEALFIHKYSGGMSFGTAIIVSLSYLFCTSMMIYSQVLSQEHEEPKYDLKYIGIVLYFIGLSGNFYHHYLLSKLRVKGEKEHKIPKGGLFGVVICPHYLFEIILFLGVSFISQTIFTFSSVIGSVLYLMARSYVTKKWYLSKFEDFSKDLKALVPFVF